MNAVAQLFGKPLVERVARSTLPRPDAIRVELAAQIPDQLVKVGGDLSILRQERAELWDIHRKACWRHQDAMDSQTAAEVKKTQIAMEAVDPQIDKLRHKLQELRERAAPEFQSAIRTLYPSIADKLEAAMALLEDAGADIEAIDTAVSAAGMEHHLRPGIFPSLPALGQLIAGLRT